MYVCNSILIYIEINNKTTIKQLLCVSKFATKSQHRTDLMSSNHFTKRLGINKSHLRDIRFMRGYDSIIMRYRLSF